MNLVPITEVSKNFNISTRALRYYEELGLLSSGTKEGYAYRVYDAKQLGRLRQIIVLRKLRIPLRQIAEIFQNEDINKTLNIFTENIRETEDEINYLMKIRNALNFLIEKLMSGKFLKADMKFFDDSGATGIINSLSPLKSDFKESKTVNETKIPAERKLRDVRIVYLPPATVASYQYEGDEPENKVAPVIDDFVRKTNLAKIKPDLRHYGFNAPNPVDETNHHGYEMWVTIPDDFNVPAPLQKKQFEGGTYAAHMIQFGAFQEWDWLFEWADKHEKYSFYSKKGYEVMHGLLEEHLNYAGHINSSNPWKEEDLQLDLLMPVKERAEIKKEFEDSVEKLNEKIQKIFGKLREIVSRCAPKAKDKILMMASKMSLMYYTEGKEDANIIITPAEERVSFFTQGVVNHIEKLAEYGFVPIENSGNKLLRIQAEQTIPEELFETIVKESLGIK